jgi:hypothetical protein
MSKETFYFSHDYNARNDIKIKKLISKHGYLGYGIFWAIIEELYNNANALPTDYDCIAFDMRSDKNVIESIVTEFELFEVSDKTFKSLSVERRLTARNEKSENARLSALARWGKKGSDANALPPNSDPNAIKERKVKERKVKKIKGEFIPPTLDEVKAYFIEKGYKVEAAVKAWNYYEAGDWKDGKGSKVANWKQKMNGVWFKDENKADPQLFAQTIFTDRNNKPEGEWTWFADEGCWKPKGKLVL